MICLSDTEPCEEVVSWLRRNQDKHEITIITRESLGKNELLPEEFIVKTSQFPNYHVLKAGHIDDIEQEETEDDESTLQTKKRKQDKDSSCIDLPRDLGGEVLKNGRTALNQDVTHMVDSNGLLNAANADTLYKQFTEHGYLYFKGLLNKSEVIDAQLSITEILHKLGAVDDQLHSISSTGWTVNTQSGSFVSGKNDFSDSDGTEELWRQAAQHPNLEATSHHKLLKLVLTLLARGKSNHEKCPYAPKRLSNDYSWLRVKAPNEYTNVNASILYYKVQLSCIRFFCRLLMWLISRVIYRKCLRIRIRLNLTRQQRVVVKYARARRTTRIVCFVMNATGATTPTAPIPSCRRCPRGNGSARLAGSGRCSARAGSLWVTHPPIRGPWRLCLAHRPFRTTTSFSKLRTRKYRPATTGMAKI
jgi:hypothetical protein